MKKTIPFGLTSEEYRLMRRLSTPRKVQDFIDSEIQYNHEERGVTCQSPRVTLHTRRAHCMEGAMLAAAAFRVHGRPPLILDLSARRDHDHVIAVFKEHDRWGAVSMSQFNSLRYREPVFRTLRELVLSFFPFYYNFSGSKSLRSYSRPVNMKRFDGIAWMTSEEPVWDVPSYLCEIPHTDLLTPEIERSLRPIHRDIMFGDRMTAPREWRASTAPASFLIGSRAGPAAPCASCQARRLRAVRSS